MLYIYKIASWYKVLHLNLCCVRTCSQFAKGKKENNRQLFGLKVCIFSTLVALFIFQVLCLCFLHNHSIQAKTAIDNTYAKLVMSYQVMILSHKTEKAFSNMVSSCGCITQLLPFDHNLVHRNFQLCTWVGQVEYTIPNVAAVRIPLMFYCYLRNFNLYVNEFYNKQYCIRLLWNISVNKNIQCKFGFSIRLYVCVMSWD